MYGTMVELFPQAAAHLALLAQAGGGVWGPLVSTLQTVLTSCGGLGLLIALAIKATAGSDETKHAFSHRLMGACGGGLMIGLLAGEIFDLLDSWMP